MTAAPASRLQKADAVMAWLAWIARLSTLLVLTGCGAAFEQSHVASRFETMFDCASPVVHSTAGGYRVTGCGVTAHFTCFETHDHDDDDDDRNVIGAILGGMIEGAMHSDTCVLEHAERPRPPPAARAESFVRRDLEPKNGPVLRARVPISGGLLTALAAPQCESKHVWLMMQRHSGPRLPDDCLVTLYRDGEPIAHERVKAPPTTDFAIAIAPASLRDLHLAQRVVGDLCGFRFELAERDRKAFSLFEMRVREELDRLHAAATTP